MINYIFRLILTVDVGPEPIIWNGITVEQKADITFLNFTIFCNFSHFFFVKNFILDQAFETIGNWTYLQIQILRSIGVNSETSKYYHSLAPLGHRLRHLGVLTKYTEIKFKAEFWNKGIFKEIWWNPRT